MKKSRKFNKFTNFMSNRLIHIDMKFFTLTSNFRKFNDVFKKWKNDDFFQFNTRESFSHVMIFLRHLIIVSCFFLFNKLDKMLRKIDRNTLIEDIILFKTKDLFSHHIMNLIKRQNDSAVKTTMKKLCFILYEILIIRYFFH